MFDYNKFICELEGNFLLFDR